MKGLFPPIHHRARTASSLGKPMGHNRQALLSSACLLAHQPAHYFLLPVEPVATSDTENSTAMVKRDPFRVEVSLAWPGPFVGSPINDKVKPLSFKSSLKNKIHPPPQVHHKIIKSSSCMEVYCQYTQQNARAISQQWKLKSATLQGCKNAPEASSCNEWHLLACVRA